MDLLVASLGTLQAFEEESFLHEKYESLLFKNIHQKSISGMIFGRPYDHEGHFFSSITDKIIGISQGWRLGGSIKTTERKLAEGILVHDGAPMMLWCVGNAKVEPRGNALLITKQTSGTAKIDPLMALFNAVQLMALNPEAQGGPSIYTL